MDLDHEQPTAVTQEIVFRGRSLVVAAGRNSEPLLGLEANPVGSGYERLYRGVEPPQLGCHLEACWEVLPEEDGFLLTGLGFEPPDELQSALPIFSFPESPQEVEGRRPSRLETLSFREDIVVCQGGPTVVKPEQALQAIRLAVGETSHKLSR